MRREADDLSLLGAEAGDDIERLGTDGAGGPEHDDPSRAPRRGHRQLYRKEGTVRGRTFREK
jgi:hypothetical protein